METVIVEHEDGTFGVTERAPMESVWDAPQLERFYWDEIRRVTLGLVRFSGDALRLLGLWPVVLRFGPLVHGRRAILGGLIARRASGTIAWRADGHGISIEVDRYAPRLRGLPWRLQLSLHFLVGRRLLARVAREAS